MDGEPSPFEKLVGQVQTQAQSLTQLGTQGQAQAHALGQLHDQGLAQAQALAQLDTQGQAQAQAMAQLQGQGQTHTQAMAQLDAQGRAQAQALAQLHDQGQIQAQGLAALQAALQDLLTKLPTPPPPVPSPRLAPTGPVDPVPVLPARQPLPAAMTPMPKRYSGDPALCKEFLTQCELHYGARPGHFTSDSLKINYLLMLLEGNAMKWAMPYIERQDPLLLNHALFLTEFKTVFERQYHRLSRRQEFVDLKQGNRDVISYVAEFQSLAAETTWEEEAKVTLFHRGLREDLKDAILSVHPVPETMNGLISLALRVEHRLGERKNRRKTEFRGYPVPGKPGPVAPDQGEPMVIGAERGPLTAQERDRRRKLSLCFYCGQAGHSIRQCPVKPAQGNAPAV